MIRYASTPLAVIAALLIRLQFWDDGGAVTPDVAAKSLGEWIEGFDMSKTGEFWAPRGPA